MMSQFMLDLKHEELRKMPVTHFIKQMKNRYSPITQQPEEVLDLSKRRDSIETRKTPSPYESSSFEEERSPNNCSSNTTDRLSGTPEHNPHFNGYKQERVSPLMSAIALSQRTPPPPIYPTLNGFPFVPMLNQISSLSPNPENLDHPVTTSTNGYYLPTPPVLPPHMFRENEESNDNYSDHSPIDVSSNSSSGSQKTNSPSSSTNNYPMVVGRDGKLSRPFKAYPRDPLSLAAGSLLDSNSAEKYQVFRKRMLDQIHAANGGNPTISNPKMRRINGKTTMIEANNNEVPEQSEDEKTASPIKSPNNCDINNINNPLNGSVKDSAYYERRKKNNAAAKKSRDRRRIKEDEIAIRAAFLERENIELKFEIAALRKQMSMYTSGVPS